MGFEVVLGLMATAAFFMNNAWFSGIDAASQIGVPLVIGAWIRALIEYAFMIPAFAIAFTQYGLSIPQLKLIQEALSVLIFVPYFMWSRGESPGSNYLISIALVLLGLFVGVGGF